MPSTKQLINSVIDNSVQGKNATLQDKMKYFYTAYNDKINFKDTMMFREDENDLEKEVEKDWADLTEFILKTDKHKFRKLLGQHNQHLYTKLKHLANKVFNEKKKTRKRSTKSVHGNRYWSQNRESKEKQSLDDQIRKGFHQHREIMGTQDMNISISDLDNSSVKSSEDSSFQESNSN